MQFGLSITAIPGKAHPNLPVIVDVEYFEFSTDH